MDCSPQKVDKKKQNNIQHNERYREGIWETAVLPVRIFCGSNEIKNVANSCLTKGKQIMLHNYRVDVVATGSD